MRIKFHLRYEVGQMVLIFGILVFVDGVVGTIAISRSSAVHLLARPLPFAHQLIRS